jgi:hypothetical protein
MNWLEALPEEHRRGSFPRCLLLMHGDRRTVADRLTCLVGLSDVQIGGEDFWMPQGLPVPTADGDWDESPIKEALIGKDEGFLSAEERKEVANWWLAIPRGRPNIPNWDIACTATIENQDGLILVEAKAHCGELGAKGKDRGNPQNHARIGAAIQEASEALNAILPGWSLSRDSHYQLANRFAWSWKIASLGVPVILVYLGFLCADEMCDKGQLFADPDAWENSVKEWSRGIVPEAAWNGCLLVHGTPLRPLLRSLEVDLPKVE